MAWTYAQLKAAIPLLNPPPSDTVSIANAINAQTTNVNVDVSATSARAVLLESGEWGALCLMAGSTPSATIPQQLVIAAITARDTLANDNNSIRLSDPVVTAAVTSMLGALVQAGVISAASQTTMLALGTVAQPVWTPAVSTGDIQTAQAQP